MTDIKSLPRESIPIISNTVLIKLLGDEILSIEGFDHNMLGPTSYKIRGYRLRFVTRDEEGLLVPEQVIRLDQKPYNLRPGEYAIISPKERIILSEGFTVDFYPSSWCIENNLTLTAGRLDADYKSDLVFGLFNAGRIDVELTNSLQIARASFSWLGQDNMPVYQGKPPGTYIPELAKLRRREAEIESAETALRLQREELIKAQRELQAKS